MFLNLPVWNPSSETAVCVCVHMSEYNVSCYLYLSLLHLLWHRCRPHAHGLFLEWTQKAQMLKVNRRLKSQQFKTQHLKITFLFTLVHIWLRLENIRNRVKQSPLGPDHHREKKCQEKIWKHHQMVCFDKEGEKKLILQTETFFHSLTLEMVRGWLKSFPPTRRNPQGAGPLSTTLSGMTL